MKMIILLLLISVTAFGQVINKSNSIARGLLAYYPMKEQGGNIAMDMMGSNICNSYGTTYFVNNSIKFNASTDSLMCINNADIFKFVDGSVWTANVWIYPTSNAGSFAILSNKAGYNWYLPQSGGTLYVDFAKPNVANSGQSTSTTPLVINQWQMVSIVVTYSGSSGSIQFFINGIKKSTKTSWFQNPVAGNYTGQLIWGSSPNDGGYHYLGYMRNGAIWNRALSPTEIKDLYINPNKILR